MGGALPAAAGRKARSAEGDPMFLTVPSLQFHSSMNPLLQHPVPFHVFSFAGFYMFKRFCPFLFCPGCAKIACFI